MLGMWVGKGFYYYSTYDVVRDEENIFANIEYGNDLEGYWNFHYFSYKRTFTEPKAVGFTYFSRN